MMALMERFRFEHRSLAQQVAQMSQETQEFLKATAMQRQNMAQQQAKRLSDFHHQLQQETHSFLSMTTMKRQAMAKQQAHDLSQFRHQLFTSIWGSSAR